MPGTPSAQYSVTLRVEIEHRPGMLGKVASAIGEAGGTIGAVDLVQVEGRHTIRDITVETGDPSDWPRLNDTVAFTAASISPEPAPSGSAATGIVHQLVESDKPSAPMPAKAQPPSSSIDVPNLAVPGPLPALARK